MVEINLDSERVDAALDVISTVIGFSSATVVNSIIDFAIDTKSITGFARLCINLGKLGFETLTVYGVASAMKDDLTDTISEYNKFAHKYNAGKAVEENEKKSKSIYINKEVDNA